MGAYVPQSKILTVQVDDGEIGSAEGNHLAGAIRDVAGSGDFNPLRHVHCSFPTVSKHYGQSTDALLDVHQERRRMPADAAHRG